MRVTVFGIGYVGLVQAAVLAEVGHDVLCIDVDQKKVNDLKEGIIPIFEPGLTPLVTSNYQSGRLKFSTDANAGIEHGDLLFIAVGTPPDEDGSADLKYVLAVAETIATHMQTHKYVVNKSTVPVGTADKVSTKITETPVLDPNVTFSFEGTQYTRFTTELSINSVDTTRSDYPVDSMGYPKAMVPTEDVLRLHRSIYRMFLKHALCFISYLWRTLELNLLV